MHARASDVHVPLAAMLPPAQVAADTTLYGVAAATADDDDARALKSQDLDDCEVAGIVWGGRSARRSI